MSDTFSTYHPIINFCLFVCVMGIGMFSLHPVFLAISILSGVLYCLRLKGRRCVRFLLGMLPVFLVTSVINPLFSHQGMTLLFYLKDGNPVTLESILYGMAMGAMLVSMLVWFSCFNEVMTSDKIVYLFGKSIPAVSLVLSMVLRFVPKFQSQIRKVSDAQKCIGRDVSDGGTAQKARHGLKILSIMASWALENSVETADSMKSRGYGLRGRTNFSIYRFDTRDKTLLGVILGIFAYLVLCIGLGKVKTLYYPLLEVNPCTGWSLLAYIAYGMLALLPVTVDILEDIKWHYLRSEI